jgi:HlyD family secretion protein
MFKKLFVLFLTCTIGISAAGCSINAKEDKNKYTATVEAESFYIPAEISGKINEVYVEQGSNIKAGEKVAAIDIRVYELQKKQAEAGLQLAKLKLEDLPSSAKDNVKEQAQAAVDQAQAAVDLAQLQIDKALVVSANDGVISDVFINKGEMASAGMNIAKAIDLKNKYIKVYVEESKRNSVKLGGSIEIYSNDKKLADGNIEYIAPESEFTPKNVETKSDKEKTVFEVKIKLAESSELSTGMLVDALIK